MGMGAITPAVQFRVGRKEKTNFFLEKLNNIVNLINLRLEHIERIFIELC
jgi:hypothetical protein